jgi:hypothetical protein
VFLVSVAVMVTGVVVLVAYFLDHGRRCGVDAGELTH